MGQSCKFNTFSSLFSFLTGVIPQEKLPGFMRMMWLGCRGNELLRYTDMPDTIQDIASVSIRTCLK